MTNLSVVPDLPADAYRADDRREEIITAAIEAWEWVAGHTIERLPFKIIRKRHYSKQLKCAFDLGRDAERQRSGIPLRTH